MAIYPKNEQLLIATFQESLSGPALRWFLGLELSKYDTFQELAMDFVRHYGFNLDIAPTLSDLRRMEKHKNDSIKDYASKWMNKAAQLQPPLKEKELVSEFLQTLPQAYYGYLIGQTANTFADIVLAAERIEDAFRTGKLVDPTDQQKRQFQPRGKGKEKQDEVNATFQEAVKPYVPKQYQVSKGNNQNKDQKQGQSGQKPRVQFTPLPDPLSVMLKQLREMGLVKSETPRYTRETCKNFHEDETCDYHEGAAGHSTDNCFALRKKIQSLLDDGELILPGIGNQPNIQQNPLPQHQDQNAVNMILCDFTIDPDCITEADFDCLLVEDDSELNEYVCMTKSQQGLSKKPFVYGSTSTSENKQPFTYKPQPNTDRKKPFVYEVYESPRTSVRVTSKDYTKVPPPQDEKEVDIVSRSGRIYPSAEKEQSEAATKSKQEISDEEAKKFVKVVKASEYDIIEQLRKLPSQISLLELINSSDKHRDVLQKFLAEVHVPNAIDVNTLEVLMSNILAKDMITYSDEDLTELGRNHNLALFITVKCRGMMVPRVLLDGGSGINILPMVVFRELKIEESYIRNSRLTVRAFDGVQRKVIGETDVEVEIGPVKFDITFQVLDFPSSFNMLLGRPWIHSAAAVPSSLHQKVKFAIGGKLITVKGEQDLQVCNAVDIPYVQNQGGEDSTFQTLEIVHMVQRAKGESPPTPEIPVQVLNSAKYLMRRGYKPGMGLGAANNGIPQPLSDEVGQKDKFGLDYEPTRQERWDHKQKQRLIRTHGMDHIGISIPPLRASFPRCAYYLDDELVYEVKDTFEDLAVCAIEAEELAPSCFNSEGLQ